MIGSLAPEQATMHKLLHSLSRALLGLSSFALLGPSSFALLAAPSIAQTPSPELPKEIIPKHWLVIAPLDHSGRRPFHPDEVFARHLLARDSAPPAKEEKLTGELGKEQAWQEREAKPDGSLPAEIGGEIGYAYTSIDSPAERVMLAKLSGASRLFVNGVGFVGDLYGYGFGGVPVALAKGRNDLYVAGVRDGLKLELTATSDRIVFGAWDSTLPDVVAGDRTDSMLHCSVLVLNASTSAVDIQVLPDTSNTPFEPRTGYAKLESLCLAKVPFEIEVARAIPETLGDISFPLFLEPVAHDPAETTVKGSLSIAVRAAKDARRLTFLSFVDDSVQQCSILPPTGKREILPPKVVLTLHGAGVDSLAQIRSYSPKEDFLLIAPTNRRPYGFDWQDWGRINVFEALQAGQSWMSTHGTPLYLTGHSMGGHGTWSLAANYPDRFVAIAPSAGWASFDTYGKRPDGALREMWLAADGSSDTLALVTNLKHTPAYILHGTADDNVPVAEAHRMEEALKAIGAKPLTHYQEGAGHWWDGDASPGVDCVDWPGIFDLFRATPAPPTPTEIDFTCADPSVNPTDAWIDLLQPLHYGGRLQIKASFDKEKHRLVVETQNVRRFRLNSTFPWTLKSCSIAGQDVDSRLPACYLRTGSDWNREGLSSEFSDMYWTDLARGVMSGEKTPVASGPFKRAFDQGFALVYGTHGTADENRELFERARSDLETWWYRANGSPRLESDDQCKVSHSSRLIPNNVILYGNADTNSAWTWLLGEGGPIEAKRGSMKLGEHEWKGDDLGAVFVRPSRIDANHKDVPACLVGAFADTGVRGARLGYTLAPFVSGVGYPDYALFDSEMLAKGDGGVLAAGWFDHAWKLDGSGYVRAETSTTEKK
jgi:predicted esterase